ncbi:MAG: packaged DNA stabilization protein [Pseudomonadota bacterium]
MQVPILSGTFADGSGDFRTRYPRNLVPVPKQNGISNGYLRPADGIEQFGVGAGAIRGGVVWNGVAFYVSGTSLVQVSEAGAVTVLGTIPGTDPVTMDYSFDRLIIAANKQLFYWVGGVLIFVTDGDLGDCLDALFLGGFTVSTDGSSLVVTELTDPTQVNPLKYGSSESDPDPIKAIKRLRTEFYAVNRHTCELFELVGGTLFPFARNEGAQLTRGALGTHCVTVYNDALAFLGSGRKEAPAVWVGNNGTTVKLSTREIDTILEGYTEEQLAESVMETRAFKNHQLLYLHLPDQVLVYDDPASRAVQEPVWYSLDSGLVDIAQYRARYFLWAYGRWLCGDPTSASIGTVNDAISSHYGQVVGWEFGTTIMYNEGRGGIIHQMELACLPGRVAFGANPVLWTSFSDDGETWSQEWTCYAGMQGDRRKRLTWLDQGDLTNWRIQRFRGTSDAHMSFARLELELEALDV